MREIKFRAYHKERKEIFEIASIDFEESSFVKWDNKTFKRRF